MQPPVLMLVLLGVVLVSGCHSPQERIQGLADLRDLYLTDDGFLFYNVPNQRNRVLHQERVTEARVLPECGPASKDPEGNWGEAVSGFQLSARLSKTNYLAGEPVQLLVLIRNVTTKLTSYITTIPDLSAEIVLLRDGKRVPPVSESREMSPFERRVSSIVHNGRRRIVWQHTQHRYEYDLSSLYDLNVSGEYAVQFARNVSYPGNPLVKPSSGWAKFSVEPAPPRP